MKQAEQDYKQHDHQSAAVTCTATLLEECTLAEKKYKRIAALRPIGELPPLSFPRMMGNSHNSLSMLL